MANKYGTLTELFAAIANKIRQADGTTAEIVADDFPERIAALTGTVLNEKYGLTVPGVSAVELPTIFTPKCFYYHGGYWWVGGNNSAGEGFVAYSTNLSNWTVVPVRSGRIHTVNAIGFGPTIGRLFLGGDSTNDYSGRSLLDITDIFNHSGGYSYWTHAATYTDAVSNSGKVWMLTGTNKTSTIVETSTDKFSAGLVSHGSITHSYYHCCDYNDYPIGISDDGYYTYKTDFEKAYVAGEHQIAENFASKVVAKMGEYLVVAGTKSDGTYLYYAKGTPGALTFTGRRITSKVVTPIGLAYANGLYIMAYMDGSNLRFWAAESLENNNSLCGIKIAEVSGTIGIAMAASGNVAGLLVNNGDKANVAAYTVP